MFSFIIDCLLAIIGIKVAARVVPGSLGETAQEVNGLVDNGLKAINNQLAQINEDLAKTKPSKKSS